MRYILNDEGYIETVSFTYEVECNNKTCIEYTGSVPEGYETLAEWSENANINAYKIVNGELTYDSAKDTELQSLWASQMQSNTEIKVLNDSSDSQTDTYSCDYINDIKTRANNSVASSFLGSNPDINTVKTTGTYGLYGCSKAPVTSIGVLEVLAYTPDWLVQRFTEIASGKMWQRTFTSGTTWSAWSQKW